MEWLFKPKVQLGLFVNFIFVMFTLVTSMNGGRAYEYRRGSGYVPPPSPASESLPEINLPPPTGPSKAISFHNRVAGELNVYLDNDMSLIRRPGFVLLLSPTCIMRDTGNEQPRSVLLRFIAYSGAQYFAYDSSLTITADDEQLWPVQIPEGKTLLTTDKIPRSVMFGKNGNVVEAVGKEIPYEVFVKIVNAKRVRFRLGQEETYLSKEQLGALRDMYQRISQSSTVTRKRS